MPSPKSPALGPNIAPPGCCSGRGIPATAGKFGEKEKGDIPQAELLGITRDELIRRRQTFNQAVELGACEEKIPADALLEKYVTDPRAMREYGRCITQLEVRHGLLAR